MLAFTHKLKLPAITKGLSHLTEGNTKQQPSALVQTDLYQSRYCQELNRILARRRQGSFIKASRHHRFS